MKITSVNAAQEVSAPREISETSESYDIKYQGVDEDFQQGQITKENVKNTLNANKKNIELNTYSWQFWKDDNIEIKGDGKMTYGQLREKLGIVPGVLSKTNGKKLNDNMIVKDATVNLSDIGWYETRYNPEEAADIRFQRRNGNPYAGYDRSVTDNDIINWLK